MCVFSHPTHHPASAFMLQCVAVCCSVLQCGHVSSACCHVYIFTPHTPSYLMCVGVKVCCSVLQCVAVCCSVLQCVAVCCSVLQCVAVWSCIYLLFVGVKVCCSVFMHLTVCCLQYTSTHCNTPHTSCILLCAVCNTLQHTATHPTHHVSYSMRGYA